MKNLKKNNEESYTEYINKSQASDHFRRDKYSNWNLPQPVCVLFNNAKVKTNIEKPNTENIFQHVSVTFNPKESQ